MDKQFLDELGLDEDTICAILEKSYEDGLDARLKSEGVMSLSAAKGVLKEDKIEFCDLDSAVNYLKEGYPYLFEKDEPVFTGPAMGENSETDIVKRALGLI